MGHYPVDVAGAGHTHDDLYYTEAEVNALLGGYYTEAEADALFYTEAEADALFYTQSAVDALLTSHGHAEYSLTDGTRPFTGEVAGVTPTQAASLATKSYVDGRIPESLGDPDSIAILLMGA